jgi:hypothetical protein
MSKAIVKPASSTKIVASSGSKFAGSKREAARPKKAIYNATAVAAHLSGLRDAAIEVLYEKMSSEARLEAQKAGQEFDEASLEITEDEIAKTRWWAGVLKFEWSAPRKGGNGTQWVSSQYTDAAGVAGPLVVRINGERHCGQIMPTTDEGLAELVAKAKNAKAVFKKRDKKPSIQIQKWTAQVKTLEDGITIATDEDGKPMLPGDDKLSPYYQVAYHVSEAFVSETQERLQRGIDFLTVARGEKVAAKANAKAQAVLDGFVKLHGQRYAGDMILSAEIVAELRKLFPQKPEQDLLLRGTAQTTNTKVAKLVQETIGLTSSKNQGAPLPNPMARIAMNFDKTTGMAQLAFYDKDKPFEIEVADASGRKIKKQQYDIGKVEDDPINDENVHKFVRSRSRIDGIVNMDSVCFSSMGISMPVKADVVVVEQPKGRETTLDDVYDDDGLSYGVDDALGDGGDGGDGADGGDEADGGEAAEAPPAPPASPAPQPSSPVKAPAPSAKPPARAPALSSQPAKGAKTSAPPPDENYDDLLKGLGSQ